MHRASYLIWSQLIVLTAVQKPTAAASTIECELNARALLTASIHHYTSQAGQGRAAGRRADEPRLRVKDGLTPRMIDRIKSPQDAEWVSKTRRSVTGTRVLTNPSARRYAIRKNTEIKNKENNKMQAIIQAEFSKTRIVRTRINSVLPGFAVEARFGHSAISQGVKVPSPNILTGTRVQSKPSVCFPVW